MLEFIFLEQQEAANNAVRKLSSEKRVKKFAGVIAIDKDGNMGIETNAKFMPWASIENGVIKCGASKTFWRSKWRITSRKERKKQKKKT